MPAVEIELVDAFVRNGEGGNPAGVVLDAAGLSEPQFLEAARQAGAPETAFVLPSTKADLRLRFFTPAREVELCGHATVAAFSRLGLGPGSYRQETPAGLLGVRVEPDGRVFMSQPLPRFGAEIPRAEAARVLGVPVGAVSSAPALASTGLWDLFIELDSRERLLALRPDFARLARLAAEAGAGGLHVFTLDTVEPSAASHCRNFAPGLGIDEEAATGTSNGALACLLERRGRLKGAGGDLVFEQGWSLGRPSEILVRLDLGPGGVEGVQAGGRAQAAGRVVFKAKGA